MEKIQPYQNASEAMSALDNGGRIYNLFTERGDEQISLGEIAKVAGVFWNAQKAVLHLQMSILELPHEQHNAILDNLDQEAQGYYQKYQALELSPLAAKTEGVLASNLLVRGTPRHVESKEEVGYVMMMILVGKVPVAIPTPITEHYDVYHVQAENSSENFLIAHSKSKAKLPEEPLLLGGVLKELKLDKYETEASSRYFEVIYYMS
jgi:hypothetical protein